MGSATRYLVNAAIKDGQRTLALEQQLAAKATPEEARAFQKREIRAAILACIAPLLVGLRCYAVFGLSGMFDGVPLFLMGVAWCFVFGVISPSRVCDLTRAQRQSQKVQNKRN